MYVGAYVFAHDGVAHGRFWVPAVVRLMTVFRVVAQTHRLHHRGGREGVGASPFGVYGAPLENRAHGPLRAADEALLADLAPVLAAFAAHSSAVSDDGGLR